MFVNDGHSDQRDMTFSIFLLFFFSSFQKTNLNWDADPAPTSMVGLTKDRESLYHVPGRLDRAQLGIVNRVT